MAGLSRPTFPCHKMHNAMRCWQTNQQVPHFRAELRLAKTAHSRSLPRDHLILLFAGFYGIDGLISFMCKSQGKICWFRQASASRSLSFAPCGGLQSCIPLGAGPGLSPSAMKAAANWTLKHYRILHCTSWVRLAGRD